MALIGICFSKVTDDKEPVDIYLINDYFLKGSRIFQGPLPPPISDMLTQGGCHPLLSLAEW